MLQRLRIVNFALIDDLELTFDRGLSVLTGETGAGKSVVVTALGLALGDRADREQVRHGTAKAIVEATFSTERMSRQYRETFADHLDGNAFTVTREIDLEGNSRVKINGASSTVTRLKELTIPLAEILGQHSNRLLLDEENHMLFLDGFASVHDLREEVGLRFDQWEKVAAELKRVRARRDELEKERELLLFQKKEIESARLENGEEDRLNNERRILDSSRALIESAGLVEAALGGEESSALDALRSARKELEKMAAVDDRLVNHVKQLTEIEYQVEDVRNLVERYGATVPDDPNRLDEINQRLDEIYRLKRKYGGTEEAVLKTLEQIREQLKDRPDTDSLIGELDAKEKSCRAAYSEKAVQLSEVRRKAAKYLQRLAVKEMAELAITDAQFDSEFLHIEHPDGVEYRGVKYKPLAYGLERCRFLFSANPGEPLKTLVKTASGGEISRLLLALKAAERKSNKASQGLLVFDEIDAGIGGQTAAEVGRKVKKLSENGQVLVITHLHQIARFADHHYLALKTGGSGDRVTITVTRLDGPAIAEEIDRMVALPQENP